MIDVRWVDKRKRSAFSLAAARGHYQLLRMLVKKGAKGDNQEYWYAVIDLMEQMKENVSFAEEQYQSKKAKLVMMLVTAKVAKQFQESICAR